MPAKSGATSSSAVWEGPVACGGLGILPNVEAGTMMATIPT